MGESTADRLTDLAASTAADLSTSTAAAEAPTLTVEALAAVRAAVDASTAPNYEGGVPVGLGPI